MGEIKQAMKPADLMRAIEYALRRSPVTESVFSEEGDFNVEITDPASLEPFATTLINEVSPPMFAAKDAEISVLRKFAESARDFAREAGDDGMYAAAEAVLGEEEESAVPPIAICFMIECATTAQPGINIWSGGWDSASGVKTRAWLRDNDLVDDGEKATSRGRAWLKAMQRTPLPPADDVLGYDPTSTPQHVSDHVRSLSLENLFRAVEAEAFKAMRNFPQPNYVISKVTEEAGEVVKAAIHCAEGRDTPENVVAEIKQAMAMLIRLYIEGDQVHGLPPLAGARTVLHVPDCITAPEEGING